jgi:hypothetical protein
MESIPYLLLSAPLFSIPVSLEAHLLQWHNYALLIILSLPRIYFFISSLRNANYLCLIE